MKRRGNRLSRSDSSRIWHAAERIVFRMDGRRYPFDQDNRARPKVSDVCRCYVEHWEEMRVENIEFLFCGTVGTGKSFYASCIRNGLLEKRVPAAATNFPRLLNLLQETKEKQKILDRISIYKPLILDNLGIERDTPMPLSRYSTSLMPRPTHDYRDCDHKLDIGGDGTPAFYAVCWH